MKDLTARQRAVLDVIARSIASTGKAPTLREIRDVIGVKAVHGVERHIKALVEKGALVKHADQSRGLSLPT